ncbi:MAG: acyl-CoA dehydrogenase [bacterium]|nr:acyl-CoA dehydrogenase [bacterium]
MALNPLIDSRDERFVLFELLEADKLTRYDKFKDFDKDTFEATIDLVEQISVEQLYPANAEGDKTGVQFNPDTRAVTVPECYQPVHKIFTEACFPGLGNDPEWGGMGMPETIYRSAMEYFFAANISYTMYTSLLVGATNLVKDFGTDEDRKLYLEKMVTGEWGGTMCLTEPDAGSDVGALKTKAVKQADGTYLITGQKIFISAGDNDLYDNIIHPVLARIEGDPAGTKGISIFLVPKFHVNPDGSIGEQNDVVCSGIEHKMGIKGSATCSLSFGDNGRCVGTLMGEERKGMKIMFQMMNEARLDVALQALGASSSAYMHAVTYAKNRIQGMDPSQKSNPDAGSATIIKHPDVKRLLLRMKAVVEAMRALTQLASYSIDVSHNDTGDTAKEARALVEFLIPICKAGNTDNAWVVTAEAIQVYGGYGYCSDYPVEQLARDSKILSLYEGTNGIQSMDLTMRKLLMNPDQYNYQVFKKRIGKVISGARGIVDDTYISAVQSGVDRMDETVKFLNECKNSGKLMEIFANATPLQEAFKMLSYAWMHLWSLSIATPKLDAITGGASGEKLNSIVKENSEAAYYYGKVLSGRFYLGKEFKTYPGKLDYILSNDSAVEDSFEEIFTGAPEE